MLLVLLSLSLSRCRYHHQVSWNGLGSGYHDNNCNFKCDSSRPTQDHGETAIIVQQGKDTCDLPPLPPAPTVTCCVAIFNCYMFCYQLFASRVWTHLLGGHVRIVCVVSHVVWPSSQHVRGLTSCVAIFDCSVDCIGCGVSDCIGCGVSGRFGCG